MRAQRQQVSFHRIRVSSYDGARQRARTRTTPKILDRRGEEWVQGSPRNLGCNANLAQELFRQAHEHGGKVRGEDRGRVVARFLARRDVQHVRADRHRESLRDSSSLVIPVDANPGTAERLWRMRRVGEFASRAAIPESGPRPTSVSAIFMAPGGAKLASERVETSTGVPGAAKRAMT